MRALLLLALCACGGQPQQQAAPPNAAPGAPGATAPNAKPAPAPPPAIQRAPELALQVREWRELAELDLAGEIVARGLALVSTDGALAGDAEAVALVARALDGAGRTEAALELLDLERFPQEQRGWIEIERARLALARDDLPGVYEILLGTRDAFAQSVQVQHANFPDAWVLLARAYARSGELARAGKVAKRFLELAPLDADAPTAWHLLYQAAAEKRDEQEALRCQANEAGLRQWRDLLRARRYQARQAPDEPLPRLGLALCWMKVERWTEAREILLELTARWPQFCRGWFHLGETERGLTDAAAARAAWSKAIECDSKDPKPRYNRGYLSLLEGKFDEARADYEALLDMPAEADPQFLGLHLFLARIAMKHGDKAAEERHYQRYQELGGKDPLKP